eukprot:6201662-Pleurochrysis_carterae.AAC.2
MLKVLRNLRPSTLGRARVSFDAAGDPGVRLGNGAEHCAGHHEWLACCIVLPVPAVYCAQLTRCLETATFNHLCLE